jgi:plastocyanin
VNRLLLGLGVVALSILPLATGAAPQSGRVGPTVPQARLLLPLAHGPDDHAAGDADEDSAGQSGWGHFVRWVGHFHPPMTAFPIAMLIGAALAEVSLLAHGPEWLRGASRWCVIVGAVGGMIAAPLGWAFAVEHGGSRLLEVHRWLGTASGAGAAVILILSEVSHRSAQPLWRNAFRTLLFLAMPLVLATAFFGGAMIYGVHAYNWNPHHPAQTSDEGHSAEGAATQPAGGGGNAVSVTMTDDDAFKPASVTIPTGTTVRWTNASKEEHTVTDDAKIASDAKDVALPAGARPFNSGKIKPGGTFEQTFTVPGTYKYVCEPHEEMDMKGTIVVKSP